MRALSVLSSSASSAALLLLSLVALLRDAAAFQLKVTWDRRTMAFRLHPPRTTRLTTRTNYEQAPAPGFRPLAPRPVRAVPLAPRSPAALPLGIVTKRVSVPSVVHCSTCMRCSPSLNQ